MNTQKGFAPILLILLAVFVLGGGAYLYVQNSPKEIVVPEVKEEKSLLIEKEIKQTFKEGKKIDNATTTVNNTSATSTIVATKDIETNNEGLSFKGDMTTAVNCGDEKCFTQKFISCEPAILQADIGIGAVEYKILGKGKTGCNINFKNTKYPDPTWVNKEMTCDFDNKIGFEDSIQKVFTGVTTGEVICAGPLYEILKPR